MRVLMVSGSLAKMPDPVYPLGPAMVGTALDRAGHDVRWFDALRHEDPPHALCQLLNEINPGAVLLSIRNIDSAAFPGVSKHFKEHKLLAQTCREYGRAPIVLGGSGFSLMPEAFMKYLGADHGITGEGEHAAVELIASLERGEKVPKILTADRIQSPFITPDRNLFDASWYYKHGGVANMQTKRGCALKCIYCTYPLLEGHNVRCTDAKTVVDQLEEVKAAGINHVFFVDAVFNRPESHAAEICEEVIRRGLDISLTGYFVPTGHLPEFPSLLKRAGCEAVELGTDSLSDPILKSLKKGFTVDDAMNFSRRLEEAGIKQCHNLIFGGPGETEATMKESVANMDAINPTAMIATIGLRVFKGTDMWRIGGGEAAEDTSDPTNLLEPLFYVSEPVENIVVEQVGKWTEERSNWICPGLHRRYNQRYLSRLRRRYKGLLWTIYDS